LFVHLTILIGGVFFPEYFLFPFGLFYMAFGVTRALVLGLMERPELAGVMAAAPEEATTEAAAAPLAPERRAGWIERRKPEDR
jgi:hypothetical protein